MLSQIVKFIPGTSTCAQSDIMDTPFGVIDKKPCVIDLSNKDAWHFTITNNASPVTFLAVDKCLVDESVSSCDFIIFNHQEFCFIEIKDTERRQGRLAKALRQLETTIMLFHETIDFSGYTIEAFASFRNKPVRPSQTHFKSEKVRFWDTYQVALYDDNEKRFN
jgi:hypothetical protein